MFDVETVVVGAGVVGLATARALALSGHDVVVLEQHGLIGSETSARNSEVIHAGIYYPKNSLKAQTCLEGRERLYAYCESHNVPHQRLGKLIVATSDSQEKALAHIKQAAQANGVDDLQHLGRSQALKLEPQLDCVAALYSPSTGIIDSHAYMLALQGDAEDHGCQIAFHTTVDRIEPLEREGLQLICTGAVETTIKARNLVLCAGLHNSKLLHASDIKTSVKPTLFARGNYFRLARKAPFSRLIYPVPEPGGLGVHLTLDLAGQARFGPDVEWIDTVDYNVDPARSEKFYAAIRQYWPALPDDALEADYAGIRPKLAGPGEPSADFEILGPADHGLPNLVAMLGIESPGLTASLALADIAAKNLG